MKILLTAINAKYIHTNLAIRSLAEYAMAKHGGQIGCLEFTINQHPAAILRQLYREKPDAIGFSCYIWNMEMVRQLARELRLLLPDCLLFFGGPEVSPEPELELAEGVCDLVLLGEGEAPFAELYRRLLQEEDWHTSPSIAYLAEGNIVRTPSPPPAAMDELPFVYANGFDNLRDRIVYYEASRGCPFHCQYCLSSETKGVRFRSLSLVLPELDFFLSQKVRQVKFVDRTFNCKKDYALSIWKHLAAHDNGFTNFHFELAAELLDSETIAFLQTTRPGLFQFEIGVQSTNPATLEAVRRVTLPQKLTPIVRQLQERQNIHLHLDLIAGLPFKSYDRFGESFNYVYSLAPDQLQLGFLKLLKGSGLYANREKYGLIPQAHAPYEVIRTPWLNHDELLRLEMAAEMVELYYNSGRFAKEIAYLVGRYPSPFHFYEALGDFYEAHSYHKAPHAREEYYTILHQFAQTVPDLNLERFGWLARYDIFSHEKAKKLPEWMGEGLKEAFRRDIYAFFDDPALMRQYLPASLSLDTRQRIRRYHIEVFPFDPLSGKTGQTAILFRYQEGAPCPVPLPHSM